MYRSLIYFDSLSKIDVDHIENESTRVGETLRKSAGEVQWFFFYVTTFMLLLACRCREKVGTHVHFFLNLIFFKAISGSVSNVIPKKL